MRLVLFICLLCILSNTFAQEYRLNGVVRNSQGHPLSSASIQILSVKKVMISGEEGKFSLQHPAGNVEIEISYTGFKRFRESFNLQKDTTVYFFLESKVEQLDEVVVSSDRLLQAEQFKTTRMSTVNLTEKDITSIPVFGGEADLLKIIQLLPGVSKGVQGSTDLFVRGGAADQNLVLLDGAPVYNTGHLFGFLSVFNSDILQGVEYISGAFPAQYGGRLSSILNVNTKSTMSSHTEGQGSIGLLASRLMIRQPIIKNKLDIWVAGRRTYVDQVVKAVGQDLPYYFYDINAKVIFKPTLRDRIEVSHYSGEDKLNYRRQPQDTSARRRNISSNFTIANSSQTLLWKRQIQPNIHSALSLYRTNFNYTIQTGFEESRLFVHSSIEDVGGKYSLHWDSVGQVSITAGVESAHHKVSPNIIDTSGSIAELLQSSSTQAQTSLESSAFIQADGTWDQNWSWSAGFRLSSAIVRDKFYSNPEPRVAIRYKLSETLALKGSYSRMAQYLHRVSSAAVAFPTDIWYPVTKDVVPQTSDQLTLALQKRIPGMNVFISLEGYYKNMNDLIGYREGANLFLNTEFEKQLIQGKGTAYGLEVLIKKESGKLTGWISYTLSRSERQYDEVNNGLWFLSRYDRRHNGSVVMNYEFAKRWSFSAVFEFISGSRFTPIVGRYAVPANTLGGIQLIPVYATMNSVKLADTHRLDLGIKLKSKPEKKFQSEWFVGIYNVYNRAMPYGIVIQQNADGSYRYEQPGLFGLLPFVSYGFKF
ncbi:MAG: TonB-dependent receptor [Cyclobacteriaceae bacterium]|nr:TonB-dependent receptor [Cyclobacteriaceae bacterium]